MTRAYREQGQLQYYKTMTDIMTWLKPCMRNRAYGTGACQNGYCARQPLTAGGCLLRVNSAAEAS